MGIFFVITSKKRVSMHDKTRNHARKGMVPHYLILAIVSRDEAVVAEDLLDLLQRKGHLLVGVGSHEAETDKRVVGSYSG